MTESSSNVSAERDFSERMRSVFKGTTSPICTGGFLTLATAPVVSLKSGETFSIEPPKNEYGDPWGEERKRLKFNRQEKNLQELLDKMPQAAFGQGQDTVYNKDVRDALQLSADDFDMNIPQEKIDEMLDKVKKELLLKTDISAELYSRNVYQRGGKFLRHKDTPRGDDMLGTLVVCLPTLFKGGALEVGMGKIEEKFFKRGKYNNEGGWYDWWDGKGSDTLPYAAFFADVDHEIMEVKEGLRMTAAYLIRRKDTQSAASQLPRSLESNEQESLFYQELEKSLKNEKFLPEGGKIASPCTHLYTNGQVFPGKADADTPLTPKGITKLKGRDLMLASVASSLGLKIRLVPYLNHSCQGDEGDFRLKKFPAKKKCPFYMSDKTVGTFFNGHRPGKQYDFDENEVSNDANLWILQYGDEEQAEKEVGSTDNYNFEGYYGNEASYTTFYVKAALFIEVPNYSENRGKVPSHASKKRKTTT